MADPKPLDIDDLCSAVRDSMYADDRQTQRELDAGLAALKQLRALAEKGSALSHPTPEPPMIPPRDPAQRGPAIRSRPFPVQADRHHRATACSWEDAERAYKGYASAYPSLAAGQSLERIAERGGFGRGEMDCWAPGWTEVPRGA